MGLARVAWPDFMQHAALQHAAIRFLVPNDFAFFLLEGCMNLFLACSALKPYSEREIYEIFLRMKMVDVVKELV